VYGRVRSIEELNDLIGNRTRDHPACSVGPKVNTLQRVPGWIISMNWKGCGRKGEWPIRGTSLVFSWRDWEELRETAVPTENRAEHL
jgi:hypothetical protein